MPRSTTTSVHIHRLCQVGDCNKLLSCLANKNNFVYSTAVNVLANSTMYFLRFKVCELF